MQQNRVSNQEARVGTVDFCSCRVPVTCWGRKHQPLLSNLLTLNCRSSHHAVNSAVRRVSPELTWSAPCDAYLLQLVLKIPTAGYLHSLWSWRFSHNSRCDLLSAEYFRRHQRQLAQCLLVMGSDIAERADAHCHGNGRRLFCRGRGTEDRHSFVYCMSAMYACVSGEICASPRSWGSFSCLHTRTRRCWMHQTGPSSCCCERRPLCCSHSLRRYASHLLCLSATPSHMPVSHNCGLIPSFSIIFSSLSNLPPLFFFLLPVLSLCRCELLIIHLPAFLFPPPPCSTSSICFSLLPPSLSLSLSLPLCLFFFSSAASMFLCVNSWDAFVEGFHSDGPFEQVVIHVCWL